MTTPPPPLKLDLTSSMGVAYIGSVLSAVLYGVTCIQTFHYFRSSVKDALFIKVTVLALLILDTAHQALISELVYHYLISNFANPAELLHNVWTIGVEIILNAIVAFIVESFLVLRVWLLSGNNKIVTFICGLLTVAHFVMNLVYPIKTLAFENIQEGSRKLAPIGTAGLGVAVVTDVCISLTLCFYLQQNRTGFRATNDMINTLIALTITTGAVTTVFVIANLIALVSSPDTLISIFFNFQLAKLYINALLTSLNARKMIRANDVAAGPRSTLSALNEIEYGGQSTELSSFSSAGARFGTGQRGSTIRVNMDTQVESTGNSGYKVAP